MKKILLIVLSVFVVFALFPICSISAEESHIRKIISDFKLEELINTDSFTKREETEETIIIKNEKDERFVFDRQDNLVSFSRMNSMKNNTNQVLEAKTTQLDFVEMINDLENKGYIPEGYCQTAAYKYFDDIWVFNFEKERNVSNPYDSVKLCFDAIDGSVLFYKRFNDYTEQLVPQINQEDVRSIVKEYGKQNGFDFVDIKISNPMIVRMSDYKSDPTEDYALIYKASVFDDSMELWINGINGSTELVSTVESYDAKCFYVTDTGVDDYTVTYRNVRASNYNDILDLLGYSSNVQYLSNHNTARSTMLNYINGYDSWAFTFSGHGSATAFGTNDGQCIVDTDDIAGYWSFVVLDCCYAGNASWANAFDVYDYNTLGRSFIGWYDEEYAVKCMVFSCYYKDAMEDNTSSSVLSNIYTALANIPGDDYYHIRYIGDRTTTGYKS